LGDAIHVLQVVSALQNKNSSPTASFSTSVQTGSAPLSVSFDASGSSDPEGAIVGYLWSFGDGRSASGLSVSHLYSSPGTYRTTLTVTDAGGAKDVSTGWIAATGRTAPPPDPALVAPALDTTVATGVKAATEFLYTGLNPIQEGLIPDRIEARRAAVLRGKVTDRDGSALPGVRITVLGHPEFGQTLTRDDGLFDLAVNGGGYLTVRYQMASYLEAQRQINVPWQDYVNLPEVVLVMRDANVTTVVMNSEEPFQVARGGVVTDWDGTRQATLLIPQGTQAQMVLSDGSTEPVSTLNIRATEYTVGPDGPKAMPARLPPQVAYTYCVELSADEALAVGATDVQFNQPLYIYLENFIGFPVGSAVPSGYYDRTKGQWIPSENGRVIKILSISGGLVELDTDGDGNADNAEALGALNINDAEREKLTGLYGPGQHLWRVPITHFTPWDYNWPYGLPPGATAPGRPDPLKPQLKDPCEKAGSIIQCENQILGETVPVAGTPYTLNYRSDRVPDRIAERAPDISLSGATLPASLQGIKLEIEVSGRQFSYSFGPQPNLSYTFMWDGKDSYGRVLQGSQPMRIRIGYEYKAQYYAVPADFQRSFSRLAGTGATLVASRRTDQLHIWQTMQGNIVGGAIGGWDARAQNLGGWSLNMHHAYDPAKKILIRGDGTQQNAQNLGLAIATTAGSGALGYGGDGGPATEASLQWPSDIAAGRDGSLYIADSNNHRIRRVGPDGIITTVAGSGPVGFWNGGYGGDGGPATEARLNSPWNIAVGSDSSLYISDQGNKRIRRVDPDGIIATIAGTGTAGYSGDGGPATSAAINAPNGLTATSDGSVYFADAGNQRIRRIGPDGMISTIAGTGVAGYSGDGGPAKDAKLYIPLFLASGPDGSLYIADSRNNRIRRIGPDGIITTIAGTGASSSSGDGGPATSAGLNYPQGLAVDPEGGLIIAETGSNRIRRIGPDGVITTVAGSGVYDCTGDGGFAASAAIAYPMGVAVGPDKTLYIAQEEYQRIRQVTTIYPEGSLNEITLASRDGGELYFFDRSGRHVQTAHSLTGSILYQMGYDANGRLTTVTDADGNVTTVERDGSGNPTAIIAPFGQRTLLSLDANGYLANVANPAGDTYQFTYTEGGLLTSLADPKGFNHAFTYDSLGLLTNDADSAGGSQSLSRTEVTNGYAVGVTTAMGRNTGYRVENLSTGDERRTITLPDGTKRIALYKTEGSGSITLPDGTATNILSGPDPRFGIQSLLLKSLTVTTPGGVTLKIIQHRSVSLMDPNNPLSISTLTDTVKINDQSYTMFYDAATRTFTNTSPAGTQSTANVDSLGRIIQNQLSGLGPLHYSYDDQGRLAGVIQGTGAEVRRYTFQYNPQGYLGTITDPLSQVHGFEYDQAGRLAKGILADGKKIAYAYDANGKVISVTPPGRPAHAFKYNAVNMMLEYDPPDAGAAADATKYTYNADRQITSILKPDGQTIPFSYDAGGRLRAINTAHGSVTYTYDPVKGNLTVISKPDGNTLSYTDDGVLATSETWSGVVSGSVSLAYDSSFRVTGVSINGGNAISYQYNNDNLITKAGDLTLTRNPQNGFLTGASLGGLSDAWTYSTFGEPASYVARYGSEEIFRQDFTFDKLGRITGKTETAGGIVDTYEYAYDINGNLTGVNKNGMQTASYSYDGNGNRLTGPHATTAYAYDAQDRLVACSSGVGAHSFEYTANGELKSRVTGAETVQYEYDYAGNLNKAMFPGSAVIEYASDGTGRRIGSKVNEAWMRKFLYLDRLRPIAELDGGNNVISTFVYAGPANVPQYLVKGGSTYRILTDHLGSPRLVVNVNDGAIVQKMDYDEYGRILQDTNPGFQPFGFAGGVYDHQTGWVRFGERDYDPAMGRWTTKDPIGLAAGTNVYAYVHGDPVNLIDSTGEGSGLWYYRLGDLLAGVGDALTTVPFTGWSLSGWMRKKLDLEDAVDPCSTQYKGGNFMGTAAMLARGGYSLYNWAKAPLYPSKMSPLGRMIGNYQMERAAGEIARDLPAPASLPSLIPQPTGLPAPASIVAPNLGGNTVIFR
jgi:RHS repeat-associated protein